MIYKANASTTKELSEIIKELERLMIGYKEWKNKKLEFVTEKSMDKNVRFYKNIIESAILRPLQKLYEELE